MRVLMAHNYYKSPGGEDAAFLSEVAALRSRGHQVTTLEVSNSEIVGWKAAVAGVRSLWSRRSFARLSGVLRDIRPEIAHFHNTFPVLTPSVYDACRDAGVPVVQTLHNYRVLCPVATLFRDGQVCRECVELTLKTPAIRYGCYRQSRLASTAVASGLAVHEVRGTWRRRVHAFIALSDFARAQFVEGRLPHDRIHVLPNVLHPDPGIGREREEFVVWVGRLSEEKGIVEMLRAWTRCKGLQLKVVGDGPLRTSCEKIATDNADIELLGALSRENVIALLKRSMAMVFSSKCFENCPVSIVEALATGTPVIAPRLGAAGEMVDDDVGYLYSPGSEDHFAAEVHRCWEGPLVREARGRACRLRYEGRYAANGHVDALMEIYRAARATFIRDQAA